MSKGDGRALAAQRPLLLLSLPTDCRHRDSRSGPRDTPPSCPCARPSSEGGRGGRGGKGRAEERKAAEEEMSCVSRQQRLLLPNNCASVCPTAFDMTREERRDGLDWQGGGRVGGAGRATGVCCSRRARKVMRAAAAAPLFLKNQLASRAPSAPMTSLLLLQMHIDIKREERRV